MTCLVSCAIDQAFKGEIAASAQLFDFAPCAVACQLNHGDVVLTTEFHSHADAQAGIRAAAHVITIATVSQARIDVCGPHALPVVFGGESASVDWQWMDTLRGDDAARYHQLCICCCDLLMRPRFFVVAQRYRSLAVPANGPCLHRRYSLRSCQVMRSGCRLLPSLASFATSAAGFSSSRG